MPDNNMVQQLEHQGGKQALQDCEYCREGDWQVTETTLQCI